MQNPRGSQSPILTPKDVAGLFYVHPSTVVAWAEAGKLPFFKTPGGQRRFRREDVEAFYAEQFGPTPEPAAS